jgi:hypothetical protein
VVFPAKASLQRRTVATRIAKIQGLHGPSDPRLPALREQLAALTAADDLRGWAEDAAASLPAFAPDEVAQVAAIAARIDRRLGLGGET